MRLQPWSCARFSGRESSTRDSLSPATLTKFFCRAKESAKNFKKFLRLFTAYFSACAGAAKTARFKNGPFIGFFYSKFPARRRFAAQQKKLGPIGVFLKSAEGKFFIDTGDKKHKKKKEFLFFPSRKVFEREMNAAKADKTQTTHNAPATPELRNIWSANCDMIVIDAETPEYIPLLKAAYGALYIPCFDPMNVDDELADWLESFKDPENTPVDYEIMVSGNNLRGFGTPEFRSISVVAKFKAPRDYSVKDRDSAPYGWVWSETANLFGVNAAGAPELEAA